MNNEVWAPQMSKRTCVEGCVNIVFGKRMHMKRHTHKHNTNSNWKKEKRKSKSKKAKARTGILPLRDKHQVQVNANETCYQSLLTFRLIRSIFKDNRGRCHEMKGTDATKGGQKDGMNSEQSWVSFIFMPFCEMKAVSLLWYWPLTWLCMNLRLIPSSVTCSSPPSPVFMSWTGNSPPSSGPEGDHTRIKPASTD